MKLVFSHSGRQFFFVTLVVAERREVLSRVTDERKIVFMAARLREACIAANDAAQRGALKVEKGLRFGERVDGGVATGGAGVPVSGFISPGEKEVLWRLKSEPVARFIKLLPSALPDRYDPSAEDSREIAAGPAAGVAGGQD